MELGETVRRSKSTKKVGRRSVYMLPEFEQSSYFTMGWLGKTAENDEFQDTNQPPLPELDQRVTVQQKSGPVESSSSANEKQSPDLSNVSGGLTQEEINSLAASRLPKSFVQSQISDPNQLGVSFNYILSLHQRLEKEEKMRSQQKSVNGDFDDTQQSAVDTIVPPALLPTSGKTYLVHKSYKAKSSDDLDVEVGDIVRCIRFNENGLNRHDIEDLIHERNALLDENQTLIEDNSEITRLLRKTRSSQKRYLSRVLKDIEQITGYTYDNDKLGVEENLEQKIEFALGDVQEGYTYLTNRVSELEHRNMELEMEINRLTNEMFTEWRKEITDLQAELSALLESEATRLFSKVDNTTQTAFSDRSSLTNSLTKIERMLASSVLRASAANNSNFPPDLGYQSPKIVELKSKYPYRNHTPPIRGWRDSSSDKSNATGRSDSRLSDLPTTERKGKYARPGSVYPGRERSSSNSQHSQRQGEYGRGSRWANSGSDLGFDMPSVSKINSPSSSCASIIDSSKRSAKPYSHEAKSSRSTSMSREEIKEYDEEEEDDDRNEYFQVNERTPSEHSKHSRASESHSSFIHFDPTDTSIVNIASDTVSTKVGGTITTTRTSSARERGTTTTNNTETTVFATSVTTRSEKIANIPEETTKSWKKQVNIPQITIPKQDNLTVNVSLDEKMSGAPKLQRLKEDLLKFEMFTSITQAQTCPNPTKLEMLLTKPRGSASVPAIKTKFRADSPTNVRLKTIDVVSIKSANSVDENGMVLVTGESKLRCKLSDVPHNGSPDKVGEEEKRMSLKAKVHNGSFKGLVLHDSYTDNVFEVTELEVDGIIESLQFDEQEDVTILLPIHHEVADTTVGDSFEVSARDISPPIASVETSAVPESYMEESFIAQNYDSLMSIDPQMLDSFEKYSPTVPTSPPTDQLSPLMTPKKPVNKMLLSVCLDEETFDSSISEPPVDTIGENWDDGMIIVADGWKKGKEKANRSSVHVNLISDPDSEDEVPSLMTPRKTTVRSVASGRSTPEESHDSSDESGKHSMSSPEQFLKENDSTGARSFNTANFFRVHLSPRRKNSGVGIRPEFRKSVDVDKKSRGSNSSSSYSVQQHERASTSGGSDRGGVSARFRPKKDTQSDDGDYGRSGRFRAGRKSIDVLRSHFKRQSFNVSRSSSISNIKRGVTSPTTARNLEIDERDDANRGSCIVM
ncbi:hypothetical protein HK098_002902 [Nowakowskiella sp. JEL0407]|nr:hypothetical protein HK098_004232 [Nowakowskiella sp. JEL0407]KAJ3122384.1 hypothetical protein HK098_002902 [Nowakowskiella sp. JEL0407]